MTDEPSGQSRHPLLLLWKVAVAIFALIGAIWILGGPIVRLLPDSFVTEVARSSSSPDRSNVAEAVVRRGITVSTIRVFVGPPGRRQWTVYETRDSDFVPPLRWLNDKTLLVGLPCGRFDYLSNPDDWEVFEPRPDRLRVRFKRPENCSSA
jgi:hypothetical protein